LSIRTKFSIIFSIIVALILIANNTLNYVMTKEQLKRDQETQVENITKEIAISIEHSEVGAKYVEDVIGDQLRAVSIAAKNQLNPDVNKVTNEELVQLSNKLGVSHITLLKKEGDDIIGAKSSDPKEINLSTKSWGYWFDAFQQLFKNREVSITQGQKLKNYWSGPMAVSSSDPNHVDKWGYYYDGTTNYIINPYIRDEHIRKYQSLTGPNAIVQKTIKDNDSLLEITGFNPNAFGQKTIITKTTTEFVKLENRPIFFGNYTFIDEKNDISYVQKAMKEGKMVSYDTQVNGIHVIKNFIPIKSENPPFVIGIVTDYKVIQNVLNHQLINNLIISLVLLSVMCLISYFLASYFVRPINSILEKVNQIADGNFNVRIKIGRNDELGRLGNQVNIMSHKLEVYTNELQKKKEQMQYQAYHDPLTGLPNRLQFNEQLNHYLSTVNDNSLIVMFLDLDRFKNINDTLGHRVGDQLLVEVAERVRKCLHYGDIYRLGGDEFIILLYQEGAIESESIAKAILNSLAQPFTINGNEFFITGSLGISSYPFDGDDIDSLVKNADSAMYYAKEQGGNRYQNYTLSINENVVERMKIENSLRKSIIQNEFELYYQPKMDIQTGELTGMEALIRWFHPVLGTVPPPKFISIAEETGLIIPLGEWVLRTACAQNKAWQDAGFQPLRVAVNLSIRQFQEEKFVAVVQDILKETGLEPQYLELEITESIAMYNEEQVISKLKNLKSLGIKISIDDFGTGYSSLNYLNRLPIDTLKIDRSFIQKLNETDNISIVKAIIALAHNLKLSVVAEGVENKDQLIFLKNNECNEVQGYFLSKPLSSRQFAEGIKGLQEVAISL
jgi:diguanylate cyclase